MITDKNIQYMRLALSLSGMPTNDAGAETVLRVVKALEEKGGKFSLHDAARIEMDISQKYRNRIRVETKKGRK